MISVIIPCYNAEETIDRCMRAFFRQQNKNFELILIDDNSSDKTYAMLTSYKNSGNLHINIIQNTQNLGAGMTRNRGIEAAKGDYLTFVDADDFVEDNFIEEIEKIATYYKSDCVLFDYFYVKKKSKKQYAPFFSRHLKGKVDKRKALVYSRGSTCGKAYKTSVISENKVRFLSIKRNEDMPFTKIAISNCKTFYYINRPLYYYLCNDNSLMHDVSLLDERNAHIACNVVKKELEESYPKELQAILIIENMYSVVHTLIKKKEFHTLKKFLSTWKKEQKGWERNQYLKEFEVKKKMIITFIKWLQLLI